MDNLINFHLKLKLEYLHILDHFNLLFYGYGCKQRILKDLFPQGYIFNMKYQTLSDIMEELILQGITTNNNIYTLDDELSLKGITLILICINFNFKIHEFQQLRNIKIIGTIENIDISFSRYDLEKFNFILRDLTTYENYTEEVINIDLYSNKITNVIMILENVPTKSKIIFCNLLSPGNCFLNDLFDKVKKPLIISKKQTIIELLSEFIDHQIVKIVNNINLTLNLNKAEKKILLSKDIIKQYIY